MWLKTSLKFYLNQKTEEAARALNLIAGHLAAEKQYMHAEGLFRAGMDYA